MLALLVLSAVLYSGYDALVYELQNSTTNNTNGSWWVVGRVVIKTKTGSIGQTICNKNIDVTTAGVLCRLSGYKESSIIENSSYTFSDTLNLGYEKVVCSKNDNLNGCDFTESTLNSTCSNSDELVMNCTEHYKGSIPNLAIADLILPLILIPACIFYVTLLCYLEYEDIRQKKEESELVVKKGVTGVLQAKVRSNDNMAPSKETPAV